MSIEATEITALERTRWRTAISARVERFSKLLDNPNIATKFFGEKYVESLGIKINNLSRTLWLLAIAYLILMLSLFAAQDLLKNEFEFFGYGFKNLSHHKELLLFLAASLSPISATFSGYKRYLVALRDECLKKLVPIPGVREFYANAIVDNYFDALVKPYDYQNNRPHVATTSLAIVLVGTSLVVLLALIAGSFLLQLSVIYDVAKNPSTTQVINLFIVGYSLAAILLSWTISLMQLPLPEVDVSNYRRLTELQASDPNRYKEVVSKIARESNRREGAWSLALGFVASIPTVAVISLVASSKFGSALDWYLGHGIAAVFLALLIAKPAAESIKSVLLRRFFAKYPDDSPERLSAYRPVKAAMLAARVAIPALIAGSYLLLQIYR